MAALLVASAWMPSPVAAQEQDYTCLGETMPDGVAVTMVDDMLSEVGVGKATDVDYQTAVNESALACIVEEAVDEAAMQDYIERSIAQALYPELAKRLAATGFPMELVGVVAEALRGNPELDIDAFVAVHPAGINEKLAKAGKDSGLTMEHVQALYGSIVAVDAMRAGIESPGASK